ncbi:hypothetical protein BN1012_Phect871 [Candidatus Phaeomarinobacter ectocarpi]|uniref:Uncharacterized protein n=1 Tax=Candidatus Phaeomarinibacter ectocarpi TaxID=1458461 RepID=X5ML20_9HYPH|nr:methyltransferase domain-containing protein [Candidatus Phaeomarinobacter ectocarpi]CDO59085.1 hypothetical protein BN1012_Phect871 [Candidatus Phaeomarinobacter ectocarpi]
MKIRVNGEELDITRYDAYHRKRIELTLDAARTTGARRVLELGGDPWLMTSMLASDNDFDLAASVSAQEVTAWPDELDCVAVPYELTTPDGRTAQFTNYSANVERNDIRICGRVDLVLACEIIEHVVRAPHRMLLNANSWLETGGFLLITTPNGTQFENPFHKRAKMPAYRDSVYGRHNYAFTLDGLVDIVESCGFSIEKAEFWNPYKRGGARGIVDFLARVPVGIMREKFSRTLFVLARKTKDCDSAMWLPKVYAPGSMWERVDQTPRL